jgi:hypothetical protein
MDDEVSGKIKMREDFEGSKTISRGRGWLGGKKIILYAEVFKMG